MSLKPGSKMKTQSDQCPGTISSMWAQLQRENRWPQGSVLSSCETEVAQLMRQIDVMVQTKATEAQQEKQRLETRLQCSEREVSMKESTLSVKSKEVSQLRSQIEGMELSRKEMASEYERQLNVLRTEVSTMRKDYERLQKKYNKHAKDVQREKQRASQETSDSSVEFTRLTQKLEEYKRLSKEKEEDRRSLEKQLETMESNNKTLAEKCNFLQNQSSTYQSQLGKRKEMLDSAEQSLRSQISQLENQLSRARDTINSQDTQLGRLKTSLDDAISAQRRAQEERDTSEQQLQQTRQTNRKLEEDIQALRLELEAKQEALKNSQEEVLVLTSNTATLTQTLADKDSAIQELSESTRAEVEQRLAHARGECDQLRESLRKHKRHEKQLLEESTTMQDKLDAFSVENARLNALLAEKANELRTVKINESNNLKSEISRMETRLSESTRANEAHSDGMRAEIAALTSQLHQRHAEMAQISDQSARAERKLREQDETLERKQAELHVVNAQLEAVRLENRHLRRNLPNGKTGIDDSSEIAETEKHLKEIQAAYNESLHTLQEQNERLGRDVSSLRERLSAAESRSQLQLESARRDSEVQVQRVRTETQRKEDETRRRGEEKVREMEHKLNDTVTQYEQKLHEMQTEMSLLEDELEIQNRSMKRLGLENAAMTQFVNGVDHVVTSRDVSRDHSLLNKHHSFLSEDISLDSAEIATANFLAEQQQRTKELEQKLDLHIEDLERSTDLAIKQYLSPR